MTTEEILRRRTVELEEAILYLAGFDVAGWEGHMTNEQVLAKVGVFPFGDMSERES